MTTPFATADRLDSGLGLGLCVFASMCFRVFVGFYYRYLMADTECCSRGRQHMAGYHDTDICKNALFMLLLGVSIAIWRSECVSFGRVARANIGCLGDLVDENIQIRIIAIAFVRNFPFLLSAMLLRIVYHAHFMCLCARARALFGFIEANTGRPFKTSAWPSITALLFNPCAQKKKTNSNDINRLRARVFISGANDSIGFRWDIVF